MESKWLWMVLVALLLGGWCDGCLEQEKTALLQLKPFFSHLWDEGKESSDCCEWGRVECNTSTGRVMQLFLNLTTMEATWKSDWYLNASLFLPFEELKSLDLSENYISGCIHNEGFERLSSKLHKLEILDLSFNNFNDSILASLTQLSSLKYLNLAYNQFTGSNPTYGIKRLSKLNNLEILNLTGNMLGNNILSHLEGFTSLKSLRLQRCGLKGNIDMLDFNDLMNLKELYLSENKIESLGSLFQSKGQLRLIKLEVLGLSHNLFNNSIFSSLITLSNLKILYIRYNELKGSIHIKELNALSNLKELYMTGNEVNDFVPSQDNERQLKLINLEELDLYSNLFNNRILTHLSGLSNIKSLNLGNNQLKGSINLKELEALKDLKELDLSSNKLQEFLAPKDTERQMKLINLEELDLSHNLFNNSSILTHLSGLSNLKSLNLRYNQMKGSINLTDSERQLKLNNLEELDLSGNLFNNSSILTYFSGLSNLKSLNLGANQLKGSINLTELEALNDLEELDLSSNKLQEFLTPKDTERQMKLINLEELNLSDNLFNNSSILTHLSGLSNLKSLNLGFNQLKGSINLTELKALNDLEELDLSYNEFQKFLPSKEIENFRKLRVAYLDGVFTNETVSLLQVVEAFSSVKTLYLRDNYLHKTISTQESNLSRSNVEELFLDYSYLSNNILESIGALTSLKALSLPDCSLTGTIPTKGWCDLRNLEELDISENALEGTFPSCLDNLTYLQYLDISNNHFEVPTSFKLFANHSHLKFLFINQNNLVREPTVQTWAPIQKLQLKVLDMSNCTTKGLPKELPNFLYYQYDLRFLQLSYNNFGGKIPSWLMENNTRLQQFFLIGNSFTGPLQLPKHTNVNMFEISMSQNKIEGQIPMNICSTFPQLEALSLFNNAFEGNIPPCLGGLKSLSMLDLSNNNFSGRIPRELTSNNLLETLRLSNNNLSGKIVPTMFSSNALTQLYLDGNNFDGEIPLIDSSTVGFLGFWDIDLSNNHLSGGVPKWICNMSSLLALDLSNNHLDGLIPFELCNLDSLQFLDLSQNNLSGSLPSCFNPPNIKHVHLSRNMLSGPLPRALYNSSSLVTLDLSQNNLTGKIPYWIGTLSALSILIMKANHFEGEIPSELCQLNSLSIMDLSQNKLFGPIPPCLSNLTLEPKDEKSYFSDGGSSFTIRVLQDLVFGVFGIRDSGQIYHSIYAEEQVELVTKKGLHMYSGNILKYMSGIDLSCNRLTGQIPPEIGNLSELHSLNLSHNNLTGFIPSTFSKLKQIESLDLSNNNLSGKIPIQLTELNFLAVFNVSYNNFSGSIPYKAQFATFDESSYMGNPFLYGPPLHENCTESCLAPTVPNASDGEEEYGLVDKYVFYVTFLVSYGIVLMGIATVLYINPYWRQAWFYFVEYCITACHFFIVDKRLQLSIFRRSL